MRQFRSQSVEPESNAAARQVLEKRRDAVALAHEADPLARMAPARPNTAAHAQALNRATNGQQMPPLLGNQAVQRRLRAGLDPGGMDRLLRLRPIIGNHGVILRLQAKLTVNIPGDQYEQEADRVAEQVMRMPEPSIAAPALTPAASGLRRKCAACREEEDEHKNLARKESWGGTALDRATAPPIVHDVLRAAGHPLDTTTRAFFEPRFGHDFSRVRIHADVQAADSAGAVHARAYTVGSNVVFGSGQYNPAAATGRYLIAHELAHVVQQNGTESASVVQRDLATEPPVVAPPTQANLTPAQIEEAIAFNRARYDERNTRLIQSLLGGPVTGVWTEENIEAIAAIQEQYGLTKDGKVGNQTFRFISREQSLEHMPTTTPNCLMSFLVVGPDRVDSGRDDPTHCHFSGHHRIEAQFSPRCNCAEFQYRQFIAGHWRRTRAGVVTDLPINEPGGVLPNAFIEDADVTDPVPNYGHREQPAGANVEDHYIDAAGNDDQAHGCRYRAEDFPGFTRFNQLGDCQPGDRYDLLTTFRGEIQRNGKPIETKFWTDINLANWWP